MFDSNNIANMKGSWKQKLGFDKIDYHSPAQQGLSDFKLVFVLSRLSFLFDRALYNETPLYLSSITTMLLSPPTAQ